MRLDVVLINHESIHIAQAIELLVVPFYIFYFFEFLIRLIEYRDFHRAYLNISFEREAYHNEDNLGYLKSRKSWAFLRYYKFKK